MTREECVEVGSRVARTVFKHRGNNSEVHLREAELAAIIALAIELEDRRERYLASEPQQQKG